MKLLATLLCALLIVPWTAGAAVSSQRATDASGTVVSSRDLIAPNGVIHVEQLEANGHALTHVVARGNEGSAELTFDGRTIQLSDGYSVVRTTLANTPTATIIRLVAAGPGGDTATAIAGYNRHTGEITHAGFEEYAALLRKSRDAHIMNALLSAVAAPLPPTGGDGQSSTKAGGTAGGLHMTTLSGHLTLATNDCVTSSLGVIVATLGVIVGCSSGNVAACIGAVYFLYSTTSGVIDNCYAPYYDDTTGWG